METTKQEQRINNAQRKALSELVVSRFSRRLDAARQAEGKLESAIAQELAKRFRIANIDAELDRLEKQKENLNERKKELGFSNRAEWQGGGYAITGGHAKRLLEAKVSRQSLAVRALTDKQEQLQEQVWLAQTVSDAKAIIASVDETEAA